MNVQEFTGDRILLDMRIGRLHPGQIAALIAHVQVDHELFNQDAPEFGNLVRAHFHAIEEGNQWVSSQVAHHLPEVGYF